MQKLKEQFETSMKTHEEKLSKLEGSLKVEIASAVPPLVKTPTAEAKVANLSQFKREFKVNGTISDSGAQNILAFCGLIRQLNAAMSNGYTEDKVVDGVIKAMVPGSAMRSYLETTTIDELTLPKLRHILRSHYKEKSATELFQDLMNIVQGRREDTQAFLMRALNLRQKVLFVSQEANSKLQANPDLVQTVFLQALENGLQSEALRVKLRPFLTEPGITDEVLIERFSTAIMSEEERKEKLLQAMHDQPSTKVNKVFVSESENQSPAASHEAVSKRSKKQQQDDKLMAAIQAVQQDVNALKERFNEAPQNSYLHQCINLKAQGPEITGHNLLTNGDGPALHEVAHFADNKTLVSAVTTVFPADQPTTGLPIVHTQTHLMQKHLWEMANSHHRGTGSGWCLFTRVPLVRNCCTVLGQQTKWQCSQCKAAKYCSVRCQKAHWGRHKSLCHAIKQVEEFQNAKQDQQTMFASHLTPVQKTKIAKLVGE